jgi:hypothetical protein
MIFGSAWDWHFGRGALVGELGGIGQGIMHGRGALLFPALVLGRLGRLGELLLFILNYA